MTLKAHALGYPSAFASTLLLVSIAHGQAVSGSEAVGAIDPNTVTPARASPVQTMTYGVDVGIGETDNVTLVSTDKVSQTIATADVDFDVKQQTRIFDVDAKGAFTDFDYLQGAYGNQLIGRFDGTVDAALIPERLTWVLQESFGQAQIDPFTATTPTNLENVNYVSTGPDIALRLGPTFFLDLTARYARTTYQTDPFDSNRLMGSAAFGVPLSAQSSVSIDGSFERAMFDNTMVNTDFDRSSVYGHYEAHGSRTDLTFNLGATKVDQGSESITGPLVKLQLSRKLSAASKLTFTAGRDVTDASTGFSTLQGGAAGGIVTAPAAVTLTNYTVTYATADWEYTRNRTTFGMSGSWEKDSYDGQPLQDLSRAAVQLRVERKLSRVMTAQIFGSVYRTDYANVDYTETDGLLGGALSFREGRGLEIRLRCEHVSRVVSGNGSGYTENRAFLTIGYRPRTGQST
jgi:hypothetical protein